MVLSERVTSGFCFLPESWWPAHCHSQLWGWEEPTFIKSFPKQIISPNALPSCWVFWDTEASVWGPGFPFSGRSWEQPGYLKPQFGLMGAGRVGWNWGWGRGGVGPGRTWKALCDLRGGSQKQGQCPGSALPNHNSPEAVWRPNSTAHLGAATAREAPSAPPAPRTPRPAAQLRPRPSTLGRAHRRWGGGRGGGNVPANHMIFPLI